MAKEYSTKSIPVDIVEDGLLWLINATTFHPRGFALVYNPETKSFSLQGNGAEPWFFDTSIADIRFIASKLAFGRAELQNN